MHPSTCFRIILLIPSYILLFFAYVIEEYDYKNVGNPPKSMSDPDAVLAIILFAVLALILSGLAFLIGLRQKGTIFYNQLFGNMLALLPCCLALYRLVQVVPLYQY